MQKMQKMQEIGKKCFHLKERLKIIIEEKTSKKSTEELKLLIAVIVLELELSNNPNLDGKILDQKYKKKLC